MTERAKSPSGSADAAPEKEESVDVSRRKLVYAAPILMSQRLFYRQSGCGKVDPLQRSCVGGAGLTS
jgi:hypothetical protein